MEQTLVVPKGYEDYLKTGALTKDIQMDHWSEALECVKMTKKYSYKQMSERLNVDLAGLWRYTNKYLCPRPKTKEVMLQTMKNLLNEEKTVNIWNHKRVYN